MSSLTFGTISLGSCFFISFPSLLNKTSLIFGGEYKISFFELNKIEFDWYSPGIRAQLYDTDAEELENDIVIKNTKSSFHLLNSISPAWTCSFVTAKFILEKIKNIIN